MDMLQVERSDIYLLETIVDRILHAGKVVEVAADSFRNALEYERLYDLQIKDAVIYATIIADLRQQPTAIPKCFVSRDAKAFMNHAVKTELGAYNCRPIATFSQALAYIQSEVGGAG